MTKNATARPLAASTAPILLREDVGPIAVLTLNRPETRNSLSEDLIDALRQALDALAQDNEVRAIVIAANGPAFSAGHDLKEFTAHRNDADRGRAYYRKLMESCSELMQQIVRQPQPVIAAVHGPASAAGCQLVASCDLAIASANAKFATPGVNIGFFCSTPMVALSRNVARKHALEMLLTGDMVSAEDALRIGLVNRIVPTGAAREEAIALGRKIAAKSSYVVKIGKEAFYRQLELDLAKAYRFTAEVMVDNMFARDAEEGIAAFIEKRDPIWEDR